MCTWACICMSVIWLDWTDPASASGIPVAQQHSGRYQHIAARCQCLSGKHHYIVKASTIYAFFSQVQSLKRKEKNSMGKVACLIKQVKLWGEYAQSLLVGDKKIVVQVSICESSESHGKQGSAKDSEEPCTVPSHREAGKELTVAPRRGRKLTSCVQLQLLL